MIRRLIILLFITILQLSYGTAIHPPYQLKPLKHTFILHRCIASVQLNKKNRNEDVSNTNLDKSSENLFEKLRNSFVMQRKNSSFYTMHSMPALLNTKLNNTHS
ncbi:uncharacterized protein LOC143182254 [Calliopsis andreniformis]|uniref:uncharacterized protein LOC143182254 n=1 Tax=Calliopsis andreniformis TaxID=337506 RepID=UPI003FCC75FB